jgi:hypothetical protein
MIKSAYMMFGMSKSGSQPLYSILVAQVTGGAQIWSTLQYYSILAVTIWTVIGGLVVYFSRDPENPAGFKKAVTIYVSGILFIAIVLGSVTGLKSLMTTTMGGSNPF